jgi:hypothetical protein
LLQDDASVFAVTLASGALLAALIELEKIGSR